MKYLYIFLFNVVLVSANDEALQDFVNGNNLFSASVYKELLKQKEPNFVVSPFSVEIILALTQYGCKGTTAEEIQNALHLPSDNGEITSAVKTLLPSLKSDSYVVHTANKMYVKDGFTIKDEFKRTAAEVYQSDLASINFDKNVEAANIMNKWVEKQTENKIQDLIDPATLDGNTKLILINALYYKGNWSQTFNFFSTKNEDFYKTENDVVKVPTMHLYNKFFNYYESPELKAKFLELPFEGRDASMTIVLPTEKGGLAFLENQTEKIFAPKQLNSQLVNLALPKFKVQSYINFTEILQTLGIIAAFDSETADLSGIAGEKGDLVISEVVQQSFIDVNERGVEAAAATYVQSQSRRLIRFRVDPIDFIVDHPFLFYIKVKNVILFAGRVTAPDL